MSDTSEKHWYALYTHSRSEKKMLEALVKNGIEAYLPVRTEYHKWSDRRKKVEVPIISLYVFVKIDLQAERDIIFGLPHFISFVSEGRKPQIIPDAEIDLMKRTVENAISIQVETQLLSKGQKVRISTGPMIGIEGIVSDISARKVNILLTTLGITLIADIDAADIVKVDN